MKVTVKPGAPVALEGVIASELKRSFATGTMTITSVAVATGDTFDCIWWNAPTTPPVGTRVAIRGVGSKTGDISVNSHLLVDQPEQPAEHRLLDYYRACLEAETQNDGPVSLSSPDLLVLNCSASPFGLAEIGLSADPATTRWAVARQVSGRAEVVTLCWPVEVVAGYRTRAVIPILRMDVEVDNGKLSTRPATLQIDEEFLTYRGLDEAETQALHDLVDALPSQDDVGQAEALLALLRDHGLIGARSLPATPDKLTVTEGLAFNAVAIARSTSYSSVIRRLVEELDELKLQPVERIDAGPLGVLLGRRTHQPYPQLYATPSVVEANLDQERAIAASTSRVLTVVTGPPGTGKSQVLTNAVAAAIERGESVLLASKNNHAIDVVTQRINSIHPDCHVVRLGKRDLVPLAASSLAGHMTTASDGESVAVASIAWEHTASRFAELYGHVTERRILSEDIAASEAAFRRDKAALPAGMLLIADGEDSDVFVAAVDRAYREIAAWQSLPQRWFWQRRKARAAERIAIGHVEVALNLTPSPDVPILSTILRNSGPAAAANALRQLASLAEQASELRGLRQRLSLLPSIDVIDAEISRSSSVRLDAARAVFGARLRERLDDPSNRARASAYLSLLQTAAADAAPSGAGFAARAAAPATLGALPVWAVTSLAVGSALPLQPGLFDLVVIDEASQSDIASAIPLLYRARRAMVVGDANQLTHITNIGPERDRALADFHSVDQAHRETLGYRSSSLYDAAVAATEEEAVLLRRHYRSHPHIAEFASVTFYGGALVVETPTDRLLPGPAVRWDDVKGCAQAGPGGRSVLNEHEAQRVLEVLVEQLEEVRDGGATIGIVSPFRAQVDCLVTLLAGQMPHLAGQVTIDTAHGFQGDERDIMIFSPVVASGFPSRLLNFAGNRNLVNVSVTRARSRLLVVGDLEACIASGTVLADLARYTAVVR